MEEHKNLPEENEYEKIRKENKKKTIIIWCIIAVYALLILGLLICTFGFRRIFAGFFCILIILFLISFPGPPSTSDYSVCDEGGDEGGDEE